MNEPRRVAIEGRIGFLSPKAWDARNTSVRTYLLTKVGVMSEFESVAEKCTPVNIPSPSNCAI